MEGLLRHLALKDSGWAACPEAIGVCIDDMSKFDPEAAANVDLALFHALDLWGRESGLDFEFSGLVPMQHDPMCGVTSPWTG